MAYDVQGMLNAVAGTMAAAWPDVLPDNGGGGIYLINQIMRVPFEMVTAADPATGTTGAFPVGVIWLKPGFSGEWGIGNAAIEADLNLYRAQMEEVDDQTLWDQLEALKSAMFVASDAGDYSGMTVIEYAGNNADPTNEGLAFFLNRDVPYSAGNITMRIVYGESAL